uniref:Small ribosomal subunit protein uS11c n=1 Tax=Cryptomonas sp. CCAC 1634B TaxID=2051848 RepID=A0A679CB10_9CRYP|nr:ribosomal protein S11 [Cryptomonas sp. CCAC 1634B]
MVVHKHSFTTKKLKKITPNVVIHIQSTFSNTILTVSSLLGETLAWSSAGSIGFKGTKKGTPFAAQVAGEKVCKTALILGAKTATVVVCGPGAGRESAIRAIQTSGVEITSIRDVTPTPHNGCRPRKKRRI